MKRQTQEDKIIAKEAAAAINEALYGFFVYKVSRVCDDVEGLLSHSKDLHQDKLIAKSALRSIAEAERQLRTLRASFKGYKVPRSNKKKN